MEFYSDKSSARNTSLCEPSTFASSTDIIFQRSDRDEDYRLLFGTSSTKKTPKNPFTTPIERLGKQKKVAASPKSKQQQLHSISRQEKYQTSPQIKRTLRKRKIIEYPPCAICLDEIQYDQVANLSSCAHEFCKDCIYEWMSKFENKCPLCKKRVPSIITRNEQNTQVKIEIPEISQDGKDHEEAACIVCQEPIELIQNEEGLFEAVHGWFCDLCVQSAIHFECMDRSQKEQFLTNQQWVCDLC